MTGTFKVRLNEALQARNIKPSELAEKTGISKARISQYMNGIYEPKSKGSLTIAKALGVNVQWLMGADYPMDAVTDLHEPSNISEIIPQEKIHMIPIYNSVSAGLGASAIDYVVGYMPLFIKNSADVPDMMCINVQGDSMFPKIENGDTIVVRKQGSIDSGSLAVVMIDGEDGVVKKVCYGDDWIELISINPMYPPRRFEGADVQRINVVGVVKSIVKHC